MVQKYLKFKWKPKPRKNQQMAIKNKLKTKALYSQ